MSNSTKIILKRTQELLKKSADANPSVQDIQTQSIDFGEPLFIDNNTAWGNTATRCNSYIAIGSPVTNGKINQATLFKGFWDISKANSLVFFKDNREGLVDETGQSVYADKLVVDEVNINSTDNTTKYFILSQPDVTSSNTEYRKIKKFNVGEAGIYISSKGVMHGAAWNDYAEKREVFGEVEPGDVVCEAGDGTLLLSSERLQACAYVITDTFGFVIGKDNDTPVAVCGRALVKVADEKISVGDCLCAGVDGRAYVMSRQEIKEFPDRILGTVIEIPKYNEWNGVKINNRVWIKIK